MRNAMARPKCDPLPAIVAGIETISCQCGWETTSIVPEENFLIINKVLQHIQQHGITIPTFTIQMH